MKLKDLAQVQIGLEIADFWITRRGSMQTIGQPSRTFNKESIGIKVERDDILNSDFLYYVILNLYNSKYWHPFAHGTLKLVNIRIEDVKNLEFE
mgnify:CR=1 FL=1